MTGAEVYDLREVMSNLKQIITVDVNSRCYRAPKGTDISAER